MFDYIEKRKKYLIYVPLIIYWLALFIATSIPAESLPATGVSDKIEHLSAYFILTIFLSLVFLYQNRYSWLKKYFLILAFLVSSFYGSVDELHQLIVPGRQCDILDWTADAIGAFLGIMLIRYLLKKFKYKPEMLKI
ncbi:VanZ family protein [bacterium BMS3Abin03]|nr:VanZ family protein [bacterium BMS3Abin03]MCG6959202.1 VanZ family protein [bacterium BMS3Abin03]